MVGRRLNEVEIASYDVAPESVARRLRLVNVPFLPGGYAGMTLGRVVLLAREVAPDGDSNLLAHELVHARQWAEDGLVRFSARYLWAFVRNLVTYRRWGEAYDNIPAELQAKQETTDWRRRQTRDAR